MKDKTLQLDENYSVEITTNDFYLKYENKYLKDGKEVTSKNGWSYPNLKLALKKYLEESQKENSLQGILEATQRVEQTIETLCQNLK